MKKHVPTVLISTFVALTCIFLFVPKPTGQDGNHRSAPEESTFDRILRTGEIRCGYYVFPPATYRDPNTGKMSGLSVDMMEEIGRRSGLKIKWADEITWGNWVMELQANRYDVSCTPQWPELNQTKVALFSDSMFYSAMYPVVRKDDPLFKGQKPTLSRLNQPDVTFMYQDGNITGTLVPRVFDKAKYFTLAPGASGDEYMQVLISKKANISLIDRNDFHKLVTVDGDHFDLVEPDHPIKIQTFNFAVERHQTDLNAFLNTAIHDLINDGTMDLLLRKWEPEPGVTYLRAAPPVKM